MTDDTDAVETVHDLEGRGYLTVLDGDNEPTDEVDEYDERDGGRFREWRVGGVTFEYVPERTHAPLRVEEEGNEIVETSLSGVSKEGVEATERYRMSGVWIVVGTAFRHPQNDSLRFKVVSDL